jgi:hypothetical protein
MESNGSIVTMDNGSRVIIVMIAHNSRTIIVVTPHGDI